MRRTIIALMLLPLAMRAQTLEECQQAAQRNYPQIRRHLHPLPIITKHADNNT